MPDQVRRGSWGDEHAADLVPLDEPIVGAPMLIAALGRVALVLVAVLLTLAVGEIGARIVQPRPGVTVEPSDAIAPDPRPAARAPTTAAGRPSWRAFSPPWRGVFREDPVLGYEHAPDADAFVTNPEHPEGGFLYRTNGLGLRRDREVTIAKPAGVFRVLVLGDSQTAGFVNNDEHYAHRLEQLLRARASSDRIEVLNAGISGYAPHQSYLWWRERGAALGPDLVILSLYVGNDVEEMMSKRLSPAIVDADAGRLRPWSEPADWLLIHSRLYQVAHQVVTAGPLTAPLTNLGLLSPRPAPPRDVLAELLDECHGCWLQHFKQAFWHRAAPVRAERELARLETLFTLLDQQVAIGGGRLVVVSLPSKAQVEPRDERDAIRRAVRDLELADDDLAFNDRVHEQALAAAARAGVPAIDPRPMLAEAAPSGRLYYRRDWHLNPDGHRLLGEILSRALSERGLAPTE